MTPQKKDPLIWVPFWIFLLLLILALLFLKCETDKSPVQWERKPTVEELQAKVDSLQDVCDEKQRLIYMWYPVVADYVCNQQYRAPNED